MVDMSFNAIQQALQRAMGRNQAAIYISSRGEISWWWAATWRSISRR